MKNMNLKELMEASVSDGQIPVGEPCDHPGCLSYRSHPCEGCGRVEGHEINKRGLDNIMTMKLRYVSKSGIQLKYGTPESAGLDLPYWDEEHKEMALYPGIRYKLPTGIFMEMPSGYVGILDSRSSTSKLHLDLLCRTIDSDYRGEIFTVFINNGNNTVVIKRGDSLAQLVIVRKDRFKLEQVGSVEQLTETLRGEGGFGSTREASDKLRD